MNNPTNMCDSKGVCNSVQLHHFWNGIYKSIIISAFNFKLVLKLKGSR